MQRDQRCDSALLVACPVTPELAKLYQTVGDEWPLQLEQDARAWLMPRTPRSRRSSWTPSVPTRKLVKVIKAETGIYVSAGPHPSTSRLSV